MVRFEEDYSLKRHNTFGVDARSRYYFEFTEEEDLPEFLNSFSQWQHLPLLFLGGGSNLLFSADFDGLILHANIPGIKLTGEDRNQVWIEAGAGENWDSFVSYCVNSSYYGIENLSFIPGNTGAAPVQNIGAYGTEIRDFVASVKGFDLNTFRCCEIPGEECHFGYRNSIFKNQLRERFIVTSVVFRLDKFPGYRLTYGDLKAEVETQGGESLQHVRNAVIAVRKSKLPDPEFVGNAGSFFKNPVVDNEMARRLKAEFPAIPVYPAENGKVKIAAGWLIEQCGWKGFRDGDVGVHEKQALVLVNYGGASGKQIYLLSEKIRKSVFERFSLELEPEVKVIPG